MGFHLNSKLDPTPYVRGHWQTLSTSDGKRLWRDIAEQYGLPLGLGIGLWLVEIRIEPAIGAAILTLSGLFAAFLFQLTIQLLDRAASWTESRPARSSATTKHARLLEELGANAAYASLIAAVTAALALAVSIVSTGEPERILAALTVALLTHLLVSLLMVLKRVFLLTTERLLRARTGSGQVDQPARRSA